MDGIRIISIFAAAMVPINLKFCLYDTKIIFRDAPVHGLCRNRFGDPLGGISYSSDMGSIELSMMCKYKNNPLNIRYSGFNRWQGLEGERKGFCEFSTLSYGIRAAAVLLMKSYREKGADTLKKIIKRWAPECENPTLKYIDFVHNKTLVMRDESLNQPAQYALIIWAMAWFEQGVKPSFSPVEVLKVINQFKIKLQ